MSEFTELQIQALQSPLNVSAIKHRPGGGGRLLKYIKGDSAIDAANRIFGFGKWGYKIVSREYRVIEDDKKGKMEFYSADIELYVSGAEFPFPGDGIGIVNAPYTVEMHEKARKEASTDALKRALRHYGDQFGLSLYDEDDYVDAGDGTLVQVKEVKPQSTNQAAKRVVDSKPTPKQIEQPQSSLVTEQQLISIRKLCETLGNPEPENLIQMNHEAAKQLINQLTSEYREARNKAKQDSVLPQPKEIHSEDHLKMRLNKLCEVALDKGAIAKGTAKENGQRFIALCSQVLNATITAPGQLTPSRLDTIEKHLANLQPTAKAS